MEQRIVTKMVLRHLDDMAGIGRTFDEICEHVSSRVRRPAEGQVDRGLTYLENAGYAEDCRATAADERLWRVTAAGQRMANRMVPANELDPMIYGGG